MPDNLHKSRANKVLAGVCGGIAEYFKVDATLVRLAWALAVLVGGSGLILYILAMIIMPEDPTFAQKVKAPIANDNGEDTGAEYIGEEEKSAPVLSDSEREDKRRQIFGLILVSLGGYFLVQRFFPFFNLHNWWPLILIIIGGVILLKSMGGQSR